MHKFYRSIRVHTAAFKVMLLCHVRVSERTCAKFGRLVHLVCRMNEQQTRFNKSYNIRFTIFGKI